MSRRGDVTIVPNYDPVNDPTVFSLKIFHGGVMRYEPVMVYQGGRVDYFDYVDGEMFGLLELKDCTDELGYAGKNIRFWHQFDQHTVDLEQMICSCRRWDLTGIPCKHSISAIWCKKDDPESYVHQHYSVDTYLRAYAHPIMGINGPELWPHSDLPPPLPPKYEKQPGRPKKIRRRGPNEPPASSSNPIKLKRVQRSLNCRTCGGSGHNSRTCTRQTPAENQPYPAQNVVADEVEIGESQPYPESQISQPPPQVYPEMANNHPMEAELPSTAKQPPQKRRKLPVKRSATSTASSGVNPLANTLQSGQPPPSSPNKMKKKAILDKNSSGNGQVQIRGSGNILNSSGVSTPVIVKGGVNYITMSNLRSYVGKSSGSGSGSGKPSENPN